MQSLLNGADCSSGSNPLNQVLKREGVDNSLFRDRVSSPGAGSSSQAAFRPLGGVPQAAQHGQASAVPHPFNLSHLSQALSQPGPAMQMPMHQPQRAVPGPDMNAEWERFRSQQQQGQWSRNGSASPQQFAPSPVSGGSAWAESFSTGKGKGRQVDFDSPAHQLQQQQQQMYSMPPNPFAGGMGMQTYQPRLQPMYAQQLQQPTAIPAGHAEMEAAFEAALADARAQNDVQEEAEAKEATVEEKPIESEPEVTETDFKGDLDAVWESLKPEAERLNQLAEWEAEFSQFVDGQDDTFDILENELKRDDLGQAGLDEQMEFGTGAALRDEAPLTENGLPPPVEYQFTNPNKYDSLAPVAAWHEATNVLSAGGALSDGALLIETFLRRATDAEVAQAGVTRSQAWAVLGRTQAENEMEDKALAAFEQGRKTIMEPGADRAAGELLTNLAISYVNESLDLAALTTLHQLLQVLHPTHAGPEPSRSEFISSDNPWALHQRMTEQYLGLARDQYAKGGSVDPDVQVGLGTLYYMQGEYGEARSCWVAALGERPDDYLLWNRLGATLANGGDPEEAVDAYRRALEIKPTFTRAIANLGVACLNIGVHREAAEHFLAALALQPNDGGSSAPEAYSLWATLRRALVALDMPALADQARPGTDLNVFRSAGFEF